MQCLLDAYHRNASTREYRYLTEGATLRSPTRGPTGADRRRKKAFQASGFRAAQGRASIWLIPESRVRVGPGDGAECQT